MKGGSRCEDVTGRVDKIVNRLDVALAEDDVSWDRVVEELCGHWDV